MSKNKDEIITKYIRDAESKAESLYNKGYKAGYEDGRASTNDDGMQEAWDMIHDLWVMSPLERYRVLGVSTFSDMFQRLNIIEVTERFKAAYLAHEGIKVGDVIKDGNGLYALVTNADTHFHLLYQNGKTWKAPKATRLYKTDKDADFILGNRTGRE